MDPEIRIVLHQGILTEDSVKSILRRPFALTEELLARWVIVQDLELFRVYLVGHHINLDGQSMTILSKEFLDLLDGRDTSLPPTSEFKDMHMIEVSLAATGGSVG